MSDNIVLEELPLAKALDRSLELIDSLVDILEARDELARVEFVDGSTIGAGEAAPLFRLEPGDALLRFVAAAAAWQSEFVALEHLGLFSESLPASVALNTPEVP
jgi:hypothetical protein